MIVDSFVKSPKIPFSVIPAKAGIQSFQTVADHLDSGFHRSDDLLRIHHCWSHCFKKLKWYGTIILGILAHFRHFDN